MILDPNDALRSGVSALPKATLLLVSLALLGGHHVDLPRHKGHLLAPAFGARWFRDLMLGDGVSAFKLLPALLATILVGRHGFESSNGGRRRVRNFTADG
jgi:hypothetical protein